MSEDAGRCFVACTPPRVARQVGNSTTQYSLLAQVALQLEKLLVQADIAEWDHSGLESTQGRRSF